MKLAKSAFLPMAVILAITASAPLASAQAAHVRWDIATVTETNGGYPIALYPNGSAVAQAVDCLLQFGCSSITLTGSGTFVSPGNGGSSNAVTGGGTWQVSAECGLPTTPPSPCIVTKGTWVATELISWQKSGSLVVPDCVSNADCETTDYIGDVREATGGLAILRVAYSDGTTGVITLACSGLEDPFPVVEGVTASKQVKLLTIAVPGFNIPPLPADYKPSQVLVPVMFFNAGPDAYFVEFHVN